MVLAALVLPLSIIDHVPVLAPPATAGHIRHAGHGGHQLSDIQGAAILTIFVNKTQYSDTFTTFQSWGSQHFEFLPKLLNSYFFSKHSISTRSLLAGSVNLRILLKCLNQHPSRYTRPNIDLKLKNSSNITIYCGTAALQWPALCRAKQSNLFKTKRRR